MWCIYQVILGFILLHTVFPVRVNVVLHSEQEDSKPEDEETSPTEAWEDKSKKPIEPIYLPFIKKTHRHVKEKASEYEEEKVTTESLAIIRKSDSHIKEKPVEYAVEEKVTTKKPQLIHPNDVIFPLIYRQSHINSMFKFGNYWYTWSSEKRSDGTNGITYYICYDEPKHCDDVGWDRTDSVPKCAFQIDSLMSDDRACINSFGVEPRNGGVCDGAEQMKVNDMIRSCGPRIRSLWRFVRIGRRPNNAVKPADVNSLICEDEEECFISIEYRIHHDRITFSLHEPTRAQTFKSALKREIPSDDENKVLTVTDRIHTAYKHKKPVKENERTQRKRYPSKFRSNVAEGKGIVKERNDSEYIDRRIVKNKIKLKEDVSEDISE